MALDVEVEVLKTVVTKLDSSIDKISSVSNDIAKLLAVHNERLDQLERMNDSRIDDARDLSVRILQQNKELLDKIESVQARLETRMTQHSIESRAQQKELCSEMKHEMDELDKRVKALENWKWWVVGASAIVGFLLGNLSDILLLVK